MRFGIRTKLFLFSLALIAISFIAADIIISREIAPALVDGIRSDLSVRASMIERDVSAIPFSLDDLRRWDALADTLGRRSDGRVTIIRRDGTVIGDSEVRGDRLPAIENHAKRPEVVAALARGRGSATRWSATLREQMMYVAVPFTHGHTTAGVVRVALPLTRVREAVSHFRGIVLGASLFALGLAAVVTILGSAWMSRSVRSLTKVAKRIASGDLSARIDAAASDEIGDLGRALNQIGENLSRSIGILRGERDLQARILRDMHEGLLLLDEKGRIALVNPALREMLLLGPDVVGRPTLEVIRSAELHELFERARRSRAAESTEIEIGGIKPRRLMALAARSGSMEGILCVFTDVTEIRRLETVRRDFVANVSHELRTPVTSIRSAAETLRDAAERDPGAVGPFVDMITRNVLRMGRLVDDLLDLSRIEAGEFRLEITPVDLTVAFENAMSFFRRAAEEKEIRLVSMIMGRVPPVAADRRAVDQILTNLVDNAIKYSGEGTTVTLSAAAEGDDVDLSVADTGPGIESQHLPRLFERFYRIDPGRSRELGGTGLGLSIVKHLVDALRGTISVQSAPGEGTIFRITLPRA